MLRPPPTRLLKKLLPLKTSKTFCFVIHLQLKNLGFKSWPHAPCSSFAAYDLLWPLYCSWPLNYLSWPSMAWLTFGKPFINVDLKYNSSKTDLFLLELFIIQKYEFWLINIINSMTKSDLIIDFFKIVRINYIKKNLLEINT